MILKALGELFKAVIFLLRVEKERVVANLVKEFSRYPCIGVASIEKMPSAHLARLRSAFAENGMRLIVARRRLLQRALECFSSEAASALAPAMHGSVAIILSREPFATAALIKSLKCRMKARPRSIATRDIVIEAGETTLSPGPAITALKAVGLDVRISGSRVLIAKTTTLVRAGEVIDAQRASALTMLGVEPFEASLGIRRFWWSGLVFEEGLLDVSAEAWAPRIAATFRAASALAVEAMLPTTPALPELLRRAHTKAMAAAIATRVPMPATIAYIIRCAASRAAALKAAAIK